MLNVMKWSAVATATVLILIQFVRPARTNPPTDPSRTLPAHVAVSPEAAAILERACRDCHSNGTRWPWYSNVAPVSWWVIDHVNHGRSHFNYSEWTRYDAAEAGRLLKRSCELAREGAMPMPQYVWMHGSARLSPQHVDTLCGWAAAASRSR